MNRTTTLLATLLAAAALFVAPECLAAKGGKGKPGGGGGGGEPPPAGMIYFEIAGAAIHEMDGGGGGKGLVFTPDSAATPVASFDTHGGKRWFLTSPFTTTNLPDGTTQRELAAVADDGTRVDLWSDADARVMARRWAKDDSFVSFKVVWPGSGGSSAILRADVDWASGSPTMGSPSVVLAADLDPVGGQSEIAGFDWSPDGRHMAYGLKDFAASPRTETLNVLDTVTGTTEVLCDGGNGTQPTWSPDGSRIAFVDATYQTASPVFTIAPDGTSLTQVAEDAWSNQANWSPDGAHLLYVQLRVYKRKGRTITQERILRIPAAGGAATSLTDDIEGATAVCGWR